MNDDIQRIQRELTVLFRRGRSYSREAAARVHPELAPAEFGLIAHLVDVGPARAAALADRFATDKAEISRQLSHLESLGLVRRSPDAADRRAHVVTATAEGRRRYLAARQVRRGRVSDVLEHWSARDVRLLADLLTRFNGESA
jgi:DNA-binding MarR family transcriptional regulator